MFRRDMWNVILVNHSTINELHDIKRRSYNSGVLTQGICFWNRNICMSQSFDDAIFPFDLVGALVKRHAWRLLAHHIFVAGSVSELICWVGVTEAKLNILSSCHRIQCCLPTCSICKGSRMLCTCCSTYFSNNAKSIGCRTGPAILDVESVVIQSSAEIKNH
jgi:hypothetical protein